MCIKNKKVVSPKDEDATTSTVKALGSDGSKGGGSKGASGTVLAVVIILVLVVIAAVVGVVVIVVNKRGASTGTAVQSGANAVSFENPMYESVSHGQAHPTVGSVGGYMDLQDGGSSEDEV